ncbi:hypothetical protein F183_A53490 [Bryobacterales bacterium F-183]|nr:hypothetical protein F183_A53490 [Bryobacterales bacterium F-183]
MKLILCWSAAALVAMAQSNTITEVRFQVEGGNKVRPGESMAVQSQVYGDAVDKDGNRKAGRLRETATFQAPASGFISKPFRWQGSDNGDFVSTASGMFASIMQSMTAKFVSKDSVLYTAPSQPGKYQLQAKAGSVTGTVEIEVTNDAPSRVPAEKHNFEKKPDDNRYRKLAEYYAPFIAQETWWQPKADVPTRFDYDGDWDGDNNWENLDQGTSQAYGYYAGVETSTHWFLHYNFFHPRDYSDNCVVGTCHENDNEGIILTVRKDGTEYGRLEVMETLAHNNVYSYTNLDALKKGAHDIDGKIDLYEGRRPIIFIEAGGHGILGSSGKASTFNAARMEFNDKGTGMTFVYKGVAERAANGVARNVGYDLLPIEESWWARAGKGDFAKMFDAAYVYQPYGNRPRGNGNFLGSFLGRKYGANKAKPFWGWHDERTRRGKVLNTGQWALDPAYAVSKNLTWPANLPVDLNYSYNPYLGFMGDAAPAAPVVNPTPTAIDAAANAAASVAGSLAGSGSGGAAAALPPEQGSCEIQVTVDAVLDIQISAAEGMGIQVLSGGPERDVTTTCNATNLPQEGTLKLFEVRKAAGRGTVELTTRPDYANSYRATIRVTDTKGGADRYKVAIRWSVN